MEKIKPEKCKFQQKHKTKVIRKIYFHGANALRQRKKCVEKLNESLY